MSKTIAALITPFDFSKDIYLWMDFSSQNVGLQQIDLKDTAAFSGFVFDTLRKNNKTVGVGGYLEHRAIYHRSEHFDGNAEPRIVHLGVDIWAEAETPIFAPFDSVIHSFADNLGFGDYGPTIILEHLDSEQYGIPKYSLYGHLSRHSLDDLFVGKSIAKGKQFATIGAFPENGDWPPHLHFQLMTDLLGKTGDFPGVCSLSDKAFYSKICINPYAYLGITFPA